MRIIASAWNVVWFDRANGVQVGKTLFESEPPDFSIVPEAATTRALELKDTYDVFLERVDWWEFK